MIKALLFDVFGTVVDWRSGISQDFELISKKYGINKNSKQFADDWSCLLYTSPSPRDEL